MSLSICTVLAALGVMAAPGKTNTALAASDAGTLQTGSGDGESAEASISEPIPPPTADDDQKPPLEKPGLGGSFIFDNSVPSGTFITNNPYTFNPAVSTNLYLRPSYTFKAWGQTLRGELWENVYFADVLDKNATDSRQLDWSDPRITLYDDKIWEEPHTKITLGGFVRGSIPLSYESQYETKVTSLSAGVNLKKNLYRFNLQLGLQASKNFNRLTSATFPCSASVVGPLGFVQGEAPDVSSIDVLEGFENGICSSSDPSATASFVNVDWALIPNASIAYNITDKLQVSLTFYYFDQFKYSEPVDQNSTQIVDSNGNKVAQSTGRSDGVWGITEVSYNLDNHWGLSLGLWNAALPAGVPPKTLSGNQFRFPFLDTFSLNSNDWNLFFDVTATY